MTDHGLLNPGAHRFQNRTSDDVLLRCLVEVEAAWVRAQAVVGLVPPAHAQVVEEVMAGPLWTGGLDAAELAVRAEAGGNPVIELLAQMRAEVRGVDPDAAASIHRGLTSQDVMDTALMLMARRAVGAVTDHLDAVAQALGRLAAEHRSTSCVARTLTQHAVPSIFGLRCARWLHGVLDAQRSLAQLVFPVSVGGAAGTMAGTSALFGNLPTADRAAAVDDLNRAWAQELGLDPADHVWHTARGPVLQLGSTLAQSCAALGVIANDVLLLSRPEIGELREPTAPGRGVSSAMPQKQNPVLSVLIKRTALSTPQMVAQLYLAAGSFVDERPDGAWHAEWPSIRELLTVAGAASMHAQELTEGLRADADCMRRNLELSGPGLVSERLVAELSPALGSVSGGAKKAIQAAVTAQPQDTASVTRRLLELTQEATLADGQTVDAELMEQLCDPSGYVGEAHALVDQALRRLRDFQQHPTAHDREADIHGRS